MYLNTDYGTEQITNLELITGGFRIMTVWNHSVLPVILFRQWRNLLYLSLKNGAGIPFSKDPAAGTLLSHYLPASLYGTAQSQFTLYSTFRAKSATITFMTLP